MPFQSKAQMRFMFANHPKIARRWADEQKKKSGKSSFKRLPNKKKKRGRKKK